MVVVWPAVWVAVMVGVTVTVVVSGADESLHFGWKEQKGTSQAFWQHSNGQVNSWPNLKEPRPWLFFSKQE